MINVSSPDLPNIGDYIAYVKKIWQNKWITNNGEFVRLLEKELEKYLKVKYLHTVTNGTLALQLPFKALELTGEVITTPFTFAATTTSLVWEGLTPVFADINPETYNIDPKEVEKKITKRTSAILAVHVYGNACEVEELQKLATKYKLKILYDAAHAFAVEYKGRPLLSYGDISTLSFHATKTFHTIEGGAIIAKNKAIYDRIDLLRDFGIKSEEEVVLPGINAKMNEFQAVMGLCNLKYLAEKNRKRKNIYEQYVKILGKSESIKFQKLTVSKYNYSYMPVCFQDKKTRDHIYTKLLDNDIKARKYFYPLIVNFAFINPHRENLVKKYNLHHALRISDSILCLPIYSSLSNKAVDKIANIILSNV